MPMPYDHPARATMAADLRRIIPNPAAPTLSPAGIEDVWQAGYEAGILAVAVRLAEAADAPAGTCGGQCPTPEACAKAAACLLPEGLACIECGHRIIPDPDGSPGVYVHADADGERDHDTDAHHGAVPDHGE